MPALERIFLVFFRKDNGRAPFSMLFPLYTSFICSGGHWVKEIGEPC